MEEGDKEDNHHDDHNHHHHHQKKKTEFLIKIPSYQEVINGAQPSSSFSQAFSSIINSEFYSPPPPAAAPHPPPPDPSGQLCQSETASVSSSQFGQNRNAILVSNRQKGNSLLKHIRNVRWVFADIVCDYLLGPSSCALYLSLRYHLLHPDYLYYRIRELQKNFKLRVVLCHVDVEDVVKPLLEVTKTAMLHDCTLLCGWSLEECGRYLETIKVYENKPADIIQGQTDTDYLSRLTHALTSVRHVNKTDVVTLGSSFGSLSHVMDASMEDLARCPGIGERKVKRLYDTFHEPFKRVLSKDNSVPETVMQNNPEPFAALDKKVDEKEEKASKRRKPEPEVSIKSALSTALAKYSSKIGKKNHSQHEVVEGSSSSMQAKSKSGSCGEENAS